MKNIFKRSMQTINDLTISDEATYKHTEAIYNIIEWLYYNEYYIIEEDLVLLNTVIPKYLNDLAYMVNHSEYEMDIVINKPIWSCLYMIRDHSITRRGDDMEWSMDHPIRSR